jgi:hypothetical protein
MTCSFIGDRQGPSHAVAEKSIRLPKLAMMSRDGRPGRGRTFGTPIRQINSASTASCSPGGVGRDREAPFPDPIA